MCRVDLDGATDLKRGRCSVRYWKGSLRFTPDGKAYRFNGQVATGSLVVGAVVPTKVASPTGIDFDGNEIPPRSPIPDRAVHTAG